MTNSSNEGISASELSGNCHKSDTLYGTYLFSYYSLKGRLIDSFIRTEEVLTSSPTEYIHTNSGYYRTAIRLTSLELYMLGNPCVQQ